MSENLLFLTGKLAEKSLHKVLAGIQADDKHPQDFKYRIAQVGVSVAALMTPELILRRLPDTGDADKMVLPGLCRGDLTKLEEKYGIPVELGPEDLKDLPQYFGHGGKEPDLSGYDVSIFAEIVEAPDLTVDAIIRRAEAYRQQGADVIDLGCLPNTPFPHLADAIRALKAAGFMVSVDSLNQDDLLLAGQSGADYLLSLNEKSLWIADEVASTPVLIPSSPGNLPSLYRAIEAMQKRDRAFIADAILDPIPFGLGESIVRYQRLRKRYPDIQIMMGVGNLTELTDADTTGINAILFGIISELGINAVLATSVSPHAVNAIAEADVARRIMYAAREDRRLPRDYSNGLLGLHDRRPFPYTDDEIAEFAAAIKDPSFRIQVSETGLHVYNREGHYQDTDPFKLYPHLKVDDDASHAFYLGVELARAQIAWQLGKRYKQDEELEWGCNPEQKKPEGRVTHRAASLKEKRAKKE
ncbi:MAG: dihydropteroate synthase [Betaproteobacteria bacterium HGW-Betaproteobacteria-2]|nr:MAG: dihydropteroate synthase [Betaproteobacteria bacterium HGW-Betaproteobacteria-2]